MTKIYLIYGSSGSWDDFNEWIECAFFDKDVANSKLQSLEDELKSDRDSIEKLADSHEYLSCTLDECSVCDEIYDRQYELQDMNGYRVEEIEVE